MNVIPARFQDHIEFFDGEEFLGCWHAAFVPVGTDGKFVLFLRSPEGGPPWQPESGRHVLVLTNVRLTYVGERGVLLTVPLGTVTNVALDRDPRLFDMLLTVDVSSLVPQMEVEGELTPLPDATSVSFLMVSSEGIQDMYERVSAAADAATRGLAEDEYRDRYGRPPPGPSGESQDPENIIRFHAEDEP